MTGTCRSACCSPAARAPQGCRELSTQTARRAGRNMKKVLRRKAERGKETKAKSQLHGLKEDRRTNPQLSLGGGSLPTGSDLSLACRPAAQPRAPSASPLSISATLQRGPAPNHRIHFRPAGPCLRKGTAIHPPTGTKSQSLPWHPVPSLPNVEFVTRFCQFYLPHCLRMYPTLSAFTAPPLTRPIFFYDSCC